MKSEQPVDVTDSWSPSQLAFKESFLCPQTQLHEIINTRVFDMLVNSLLIKLVPQKLEQPSKILSSCLFENGSYSTS